MVAAMVSEIVRGRPTFRRLKSSILEFLNYSDRIATMAATTIVVEGLRKRFGEVTVLGDWGSCRDARAGRSQTPNSGHPPDAAETRR
jgi:hypothetical protein